MYYDCGKQSVFYTLKGEGEPVLLLHGWGCSHAIFDPFVDALARHYAVYAIDLPGFGQSPEPDSDWGTDEYTQLIERFAADNGLVRPSLVGHSFGGRLSILFASRNQVDKVVLVDAAGLVPHRSLAFRIRTRIVKAAAAICRMLLPGGRAEALIERFRRRAGSADYAAASPRMRAVLSRAVNEDLGHVMPEIKAPVLLFWGDRDTATPISDARIMQSAIPDAGLVTVPGAGHFSFLEAPAVFAAALESFFNLDR
ncbi:MAG: alpha/beta hydrolase [Alistipes sp.]|nr:alpha/beta hydrolase [Alistipes sp.]